MQSYTLDHVTDEVLLQELATLVARDRIGTAALLAHIGEVDARGLYVPAGYPSMHAYCVEELRLSEDSAYKRIRAARAARQFPAIFPAVADGRLHLAAVSLLAPHLTAVNSDELIEAATHRRRFEIEQFLAGRFGAPEAPPTIRPLPPGIPGSQSLRALAPGRVAARAPQLALEQAGTSDALVASLGSPVGSTATGDLIPDDVAAQLAPGRVEAAHVGGAAGAASGDELAPGRVESSAIGPLPPRSERYSLKVTIDHRTHEKLRYAQALLSHAVPGRDIAQVLDRALEALILQLERQKFGATTRPRRARTSLRKRHVPAHVRRAVWERDQGQCTFVSTSGKRCQARRYLEFDHIHPVARGGKGTTDNMRLRCRAHNQYEADRMRRATTEREEALSTVPGLTNDALASTPPAGSEKPRQLAPPGP